MLRVDIASCLEMVEAWDLFWLAVSLSFTSYFLILMTSGLVSLVQMLDILFALVWRFDSDFLRMKARSSKKVLMTSRL